MCVCVSVRVQRFFCGADNFLFYFNAPIVLCCVSREVSNLRHTHYSVRYDNESSVTCIDNCFFDRINNGFFQHTFSQHSQSHTMFYQLKKKWTKRRSENLKIYANEKWAQNNPNWTRQWQRQQKFISFNLFFSLFRLHKMNELLCLKIKF